MKDELAMFANKPEHKNVDSTIVAILSHGVEGAVCGTDSTGITMRLQVPYISNLGRMRLSVNF